MDAWLLRAVMVVSALASCRPATGARSEGAPNAAASAPSLAPTTSASSDALAAPTAATAATIAVAAPTAPRTFTPAGGIVFHHGAPVAATQTLLGKETHFGGMSADGTAFVIGSDQKGTLVSAARPGGVSFDASSIDRAIFSPGGRAVALLQFLGPLEILSVPDATVLYKGDVSPCNLRFVSDDVVVFHAESKDETARLYRLDLSSHAAPVAIGPARRADECTSSRDGATWLVHADTSEGTVDAVDGASGSARRLYAPLNRAGLSFAMSPVADRVCLARQGAADVRCLRVADGVRETVEEDASYPEIEFDPDGERLLVWRTVQKPGSDMTRAAAIADFHDGTLRLASALRLHGGGSGHLLAGGHVFASGSASGIEVFDVESGAIGFVARSPFYAVYPLPGRPRQLVGGSERSGLEDMWLVNLH